jgi:hypothetical protein
MPSCEADPWRLQYFEGVECPADVRVATEDAGREARALPG